MSYCGYNEEFAAVRSHTDGDGVVTLEWVTAGKYIHIYRTLLEESTESELKFITDKYDIGDCCPNVPGVVHAVRKD